MFLQRLKKIQRNQTNLKRVGHWMSLLLWKFVLQIVENGRCSSIKNCTSYAEKRVFIKHKRSVLRLQRWLGIRRFRRSINFKTDANAFSPHKERATSKAHDCCWIFIQPNNSNFPFNSWTSLELKFIGINVNHIKSLWPNLIGIKNC